MKNEASLFLSICSLKNAISLVLFIVKSRLYNQSEPRKNYDADENYLGYIK